MLEDIKLLDTVKACFHSGAFIFTGLFTYLIIVTVHGTPELQTNARYALLCQHCACVAGFNVTGATLHALRALRLSTMRLVCWVLFDLQVALARGLIITLTLMAVNTCLSICKPLHYLTLVHRTRTVVILVSWFLALVNPVVFTVLACVDTPWDYVVGPDPMCSTTLEGKAPRISALALLALLILLIVGSYVLIYLEGHRAGHFSRSNSRGRRTILIHTLQMSLHLLPAVMIISRLDQYLPLALANFTVFCAAQSLSPVVYGLRCRELRSHLARFIPQPLQSLRSCGRVHDTSNGTSSSLGNVGSSTETVTSTSTCVAIGNYSAGHTDSDCEEQDSTVTCTTVQE
ncbi:olfactory receptor 4K17 [Chanos chanos]|uniref:Olfactory receptor 4K17 n=1 Tax=Chanos chanos TaxID=29144 RepID=A0A6J2VFM9_CHACN|nr:olfactory receptor 4K17-like [Chanos chanos]